MTSSSSQEHPKFFARSRTPESPRPVHIPEPSTIPVLENQTDPLFNLMSTHLDPPFAARNMTAMDHEMAELAATQAAATAQPTETTGNEENDDESMVHQNSEDSEGFGDVQGMSSIAQDTSGTQGQSDSTLNVMQSSQFPTQPPASVDSFEPLTSSINTSEKIPSFSHPSTGAYPSDPNPVDTASTEEPTNAASPSQKKSAGNGESTEVNYQALLDNIVSPQESEAPAASNAPAIVSQPSENADTPTSSSATLPSTNLATPAGLPPRPPPQEKPAIHPNYTPGQDISAYHYPPAHHANPQAHQNPAPNNGYRNSQYPTPNVMSPSVAALGSNGLPPPPMASFQQQTRPVEQPEGGRSSFTKQQEEAVRSGTNPERGSREDEKPWPREIQQKYDQFLRDEEVYTKEGAWDKFPRDSRLFVGNLPSEIVTKRDIFHIFHRFGRLAQISIKQAYGFVQFMDKEACEAALHSEQGGKIKDRNMHLEISKPPKNSRNQASAAGEQLRASHYRRSRSPERRPGSRGQRNNDRFSRNPPFSDFRDEPRRRDDYRPNRSPSPRGFRGRDNYRSGRNRTPPGGYRGGRERSRSPYGRGIRHNRSSSPRRRSLDDDDMLPLPKRHPQDVPDVQVLLFDQLDRPFVEYVEKGFRDRGLRVAVLMMPDLPIQAIIRRQILEGVHAIVKLHRDALITGKIPIQIFDRSGGASNVRFEEYAEALPTAAELVVRTKQKITTTAAALPQFTQLQQPQQQQAFPALQQYGIQPHMQQISQQAQQQLQQHLPPSAAAAVQQQPSLASLISTLDGPALQKLLGAMQANPQQQQQLLQQQQQQQQVSPTVSVPQGQNQNQDLQALLSQIGKQQAGGQHTPITPQSAGFSGVQGYPPAQQQQMGQGGYGGFVGGGPSVYPPQGQVYPQQGHPQQAQFGAMAHGQNVQAMLDQITRGGGSWKQ